MLLPWLGENTPRVLVLGDLILDEYIDGEVSRISPEAPVPILRVKNISYSLGGAANTGRNIKLCGGEVFLVGALGCDKDGDAFKDLLIEDKISSQFLIEDKAFQTIKKTRITALRQQLLRFDSEKSFKLSENQTEQIFSLVSRLTPSVIVLSDYQKGFLTKKNIKDILSLAESLGVKTIVDPKLEDFSYYSSCSLITPNLKEAKRALGVEDFLAPEEIISGLRKKFNLKDVLLTLGPEGMFYSKFGEAKGIYQRAETKEVYDVSGAGDTVVALMALCFGANLSFKEAVFYANKAASLAVSKWKTQAVTQCELEELLLEKKEVSLGSLSFLKKRGKKIVFTNGCFDVLHYGHISYLERAKALGDVLVVGLNDDASVRRIKGKKRPINSLSHRKKVLESLRFVDLVIPFEEDTPLNLIKKVFPNFLVKGADYKESDIVGSEYVRSYGGKVEIISFVEGLSSSSTLEKMRETLQ